MLVKELVYSCLDLAKASTSDNSFWTEEHVLFLCKKYRAFLIKKEHDKEKSSADIPSEFEYQQICLDLEKVPAIDGEPCTGGYYLRTTQKIPKIVDDSQPSVYPIDFLQGTNISFISRDRMRYTGTNPYLKNITYVCLGPDYHLYLNSSNPQFMYLKKLRVNAIFEDFEDAAPLLCDGEGSSIACDPLDMEFPIREYLVPALIELVVKQLTGAKYQVEDSRNDDKDNIPEKVSGK